MNERTRLGDITLCDHCGFAIQLRRFGSSDTWWHFRIPVTPHSPVPKRSLWDYPGLYPGGAAHG